MGKLILNRDFTKFLTEDFDSFPHQVKVQFGDRLLVCNGMVLAQQSSIIEENIRHIRQNKILKFDKMVNIGTVEEKVNCIKYMYGATLALNLKEIETTTIFASLYGVSDLFNKCLKWIGNNLSARNLINFYKMSDKFEAEEDKSKMKKVVNRFLKENKDSIGEELLAIILNGGSVHSELVMSIIIKRCPKNGAKLMTEWCKQSSENQVLVIKEADKIDFVTLFPVQKDFTGFIGVLQKSGSAEVMKQVMTIQQSYYVKITQNLSAPSNTKPSKTKVKPGSAKQNNTKSSKAKSSKAKPDNSNTNIINITANITNITKSSDTNPAKKMKNKK